MQIDSKTKTDLALNLSWQSQEAAHTEQYYVPKANWWRDIFPPSVLENVIGRCSGEECLFSFKAGEITPAYNPTLVKELPLTSFRQLRLAGMQIYPRIGRFYPGGLLQGVSGYFPQTLTPFRVVDLQGDRITVDLNHPMSPYPIDLRVTIGDLYTIDKERGGRCSDWLEAAAENGPGMQARWRGRPTDFIAEKNLPRPDESPDAVFYDKPRLISHIDSQASMIIRRAYAAQIPPGSRVLDLMSSMHSHLPNDMNLSVTGLGMNREEMEANPILDGIRVHDLNESPRLPFANGEFDAVACSLSIEYIKNPSAVLAESHRVLKPGGVLLLSFSNRWFPPKVTRLWTELHDFERLGFVLHLVIDTDGFEKLSTFTSRNWPRPEDDRHFPELMVSDPVYVVSGVRNQA
jgi:SAM-dependent methyltransferase